MPKQPIPPKELQPLIPLDELKSVVGRIAHVPKEQIEKAEAERPKRKRTKKD